MWTILNDKKHHWPPRDWIWDELPLTHPNKHNLELKGEQRGKMQLEAEEIKKALH